MYVFKYCVHTEMRRVISVLRLHVYVSMGNTYTAYRKGTSCSILFLTYSMFVILQQELLYKTITYTT